ncbi:MAG: endonuclease/exonuclease/phosphatase family protein [Anaerolineales bacterium]|nr:endonuclease/exonuclease/phosphatase family protein [Anaerolineales bacterium]
MAPRKTSFLLTVFSLITAGLVLGACLGPAGDNPVDSPTQIPTTAPTPSGAATLTASQTTAPTRPPTSTPANTPTITPTLDPAELAFLEKPGSDTLRVLNYNILWDSIFPDDDPQNHEWREVDKSAAFIRILNAVDPDIICIQEVNPRRDAGQVADLINEAFGGPDIQEWQAVGGRDSFIASRFELVQEGFGLSVPSLPPDQEQAGVLIDLPDETYGSTDLYVICAHFKSGGGPANINIRQRQADALIGHITDSMAPGDDIDLPAGTPYIMMGDFNVYQTDPAAHLDTLLTGDIANEDKFGADFHPDWDQTDLTDARPSHNGQGELYYTWREDNSPFMPGALDRILFTDSVLVLENAFVLNTTLLSDAALAAAGLEIDDIQYSALRGFYDHFPMVVDFRVVN